MGYVIRMPKLGMAMEEGTVVEWEISEGDTVTPNERIAVIESEKTTADVDAREAGVLRRILVEVDGTVPPGEPIGIVAGPEEDLEPYLADIE